METIMINERFVD